MRNFSDFSMFKDLDDILSREKFKKYAEKENWAETYVQTGIFKRKTAPKSITNDIRRINEKVLSSATPIETLVIEELKEWLSNIHTRSYRFGDFILILWNMIDIDIFHWINFTCDYFLTNLGGKTTSKTAKDLPGNYAGSIDALFNNKGKLSAIVPSDNFNVYRYKSNGEKRKYRQYNENNGYTVDIPKLCEKFYYYLLHDLYETPLYNYSVRNRKRVFMYINVLYKCDIINDTYENRLDKYNFEYSDRYIFERLIGLNWSTTLTRFLHSCFSTRETKKLDDDKNRKNRFLYYIISSGANSIMTFSRSFLFYELFLRQRSKGKNSEIREDYIMSLAYSFCAMVDFIENEFFYYKTYKTFYEMFDKYYSGPGTELDAIEEIKKESIKNILIYYKKHRNLKNDFIPDKFVRDWAESELHVEKTKSGKENRKDGEYEIKVANKTDDVNVYIQKKTIEFNEKPYRKIDMDPLTIDDIPEIRHVEKYKPSKDDYDLF